MTGLCQNSELRPLRNEPRLQMRVTPHYFSNTTGQPITLPITALRLHLARIGHAIRISVDISLACAFVGVRTESIHPVIHIRVGLVDLSMIGRCSAHIHYQRMITVIRYSSRNDNSPIVVIPYVLLCLNWPLHQSVWHCCLLYGGRLPAF